MARVAAAGARTRAARRAADPPWAREAAAARHARETRGGPPPRVGAALWRAAECDASPLGGRPTRRRRRVRVPWRVSFVSFASASAAAEPATPARVARAAPWRADALVARAPGARRSARTASTAWTARTWRSSRGASPRSARSSRRSAWRTAARFRWTAQLAGELFEMYPRDGGRARGAVRRERGARQGGDVGRDAGGPNGPGRREGDETRREKKRGLDPVGGVGPRAFARRLADAAASSSAKMLVSARRFSATRTRTRTSRRASTCSSARTPAPPRRDVTSRRRERADARAPGHHAATRRRRRRTGTDFLNWGSARRRRRRRNPRRVRRRRRRGTGRVLRQRVAERGGTRFAVDEDVGDDARTCVPLRRAFTRTWRCVSTRRKRRRARERGWRVVANAPPRFADDPTREGRSIRRRAEEEAVRAEFAELRPPCRGDRATRLRTGDAREDDAAAGGGSDETHDAYGATGDDARGSPDLPEWSETAAAARTAPRTRRRRDEIRSRVKGSSERATIRAKYTTLSENVSTVSW